MHDYRALNNVIIKDRLPSPTTDELLDELHGSRFFTKLGLRSGYHKIQMATINIHKRPFKHMKATMSLL